MLQLVLTLPPLHVVALELLLLVFHGTCWNGGGSCFHDNYGNDFHSHGIDLNACYASVWS